MSEQLTPTAATDQLDRDAPMPLHAQVSEQIRHRIAIGDWRPGHELPSIRADLGATLADVVREMLLTTTSERQGRAIDKDAGGAGMEVKKQQGYF